jgi:LPS O-antigen subunit length determinant protein (WzzB/FepE family)
MSRNVDNPTWKSVATYLKIRDVFANKLAQRQSGSLDARSNTDLQLAYDLFVQKLKQDDLGFADVYDRFLSQDKIYYKAITKAAR